MLGAESLAGVVADAHGGRKIRIHAQCKLGTVERAGDVLARLRGACIAEDAISQDLLEGHHGRVAEIDLPRLLEPFKRIVAGRFADAVGIQGAACLGQQAFDAQLSGLYGFRLLDFRVQRDKGGIAAELFAHLLQSAIGGVHFHVGEQFAHARKLGVGECLEARHHVGVAGIQRQRGTQQRVGSLRSRDLVALLRLDCLLQQFRDACGIGFTLLGFGDALEQVLDLGILGRYQQGLVGNLAGPGQVTRFHDLFRIGAQQPGNLGEQFETAFVFRILLQHLLYVFKRILSGWGEQVTLEDQAVGLAQQRAHQQLFVLGQGAWFEHRPQHKAQDQHAESGGDAEHQARLLHRLHDQRGGLLAHGRIGLRHAQEVERKIAAAAGVVAGKTQRAQTLGGAGRGDAAQLLDQCIVANHQATQRLDEIQQVGEAVVRILGQHLVEDGLQRFQVVRQGRRWLQGMAHQHRHRILAGERWLAGQQFVEQDAQRILICAAIDVLAAGLLRAHVGGRAQHQSGLGDARGEHVGLLGDAEIGEHRRGRIAEHHVGGLEVAMDHAIAMRKLQAIGQLHHHADGLAQRQALAHAVGQRAAFEQFHGDVGDIIAGDDVVDRDDIAVRQLGHGAAFEQETPLELGHGAAVVSTQLAAHDLDRDLAVERMLDREVDGRHAALAQLADHLVTRNVLEAIGHVPFLCRAIIAKGVARPSPGSPGVGLDALPIGTGASSAQNPGRKGWPARVGRSTGPAASSIPRKRPELEQA